MADHNNSQSAENPSSLGTEGIAENKPQTAGTLLRTAREEKGFSVEELGRYTMLSPQTISKLEADQFTDTTQSVYARGYLRKCAEILEGDADQWVAAYNQGEFSTETQAKQPKTPNDLMATEAQDRAEKKSSIAGILIGLVVLVLVIAGYFLWQASSSNTSVDEQAAATATDESDSTDTAATEPEELAVVDGQNSESASTEDTSVEESAANADTTNLENDQLTQTLGLEQPAQSATMAAQEPDDSTTVQSTSDNVLQVEFSEASWISVADANGEQLLLGTYENTSKTLSGEPPFKVNIGYVPGVKIQLNGQPIAVKAAGNHTAQITIDSDLS